eukprot:2025042-Pleurochrysis_carterae.AAC.1
MIHVQQPLGKGCRAGGRISVRFALSSRHGYNSVRGTDLQLAVAQGGWRSEAHERCARISLADVLRIPTIIDEDAEEISPAVPR